jgi:hypothetical protein
MDINFVLVRPCSPNGTYFIIAIRDVHNPLPNLVTGTLNNPITLREKPDAINKKKQGNEWDVPDR